MEANYAAYMVGKQNIQIMEAKIPAIKSTEVLIRAEHIGICGSDIHFYESGEIDGHDLPFPLLLGHECAGTVVETGKDVLDLRVGDKVCIEPGIPCGKCEYCKSGRYNICEKVNFMAAPPFADGLLKKYIAFPAEMVHKLRPNMDTVDGAMVEPLAVGFHAAKLGGAAFGKSAVILGCGCIGLLTLIACKQMGVQDITVLDLMENRLALAKELGATNAVNPSKEDSAKAVLELTDGAGADIIFETAGSRRTTYQTSELVKRGGTIVLVGNVFGDVPYNFFPLMLKEATLKAAFRYTNIFPSVINAIGDGRIDAKKLVTHIFDFEKTNDAFNFVINHKDEVVKGMIKL